MKFINDKNINNNTYINKDFQALWAELLDIIPKYTNKWDPRQANESDPLAVLIKLLAIFSDKLNYNIDKNILENYPQTLTQERSAYNIYDILGYKAPWYKSAIMNVEFVCNSSLGNVTTYTLPRFTMLSDDNNKIVYTTLNNVQLDFNKLGIANQQAVSCIEGTINDFTINGDKLIRLENIDNENRLYFTERNVAENGIFISDTETFNLMDVTNLQTNWKKVDNIYQAISDEKAFEFAIDPATGACYIQFSDSIANLIGSGIYIKYILSNGQAGNVKQFTITKFLNDIKLNIDDTNVDLNSYVSITNSSASTSGKNPATIDEMYTNFKRTQNICNTLVTLLDYEKFIFDYENIDGTNIVSNVVVSDRTCDLYDSYDIQTLTTEGENLKNKLIEGSDFTAFNLRFYPLENVVNIYDKDTFNKSFDYCTSTKQGRINDAIQITKALNYNSKPIGYPIKIKYDLEGQVYLKNKYTKEEKTQIFDNIKFNIYSQLNARNINFGEAPDFKAIVNLIESADERIDYVALLPIKYIDKDIKAPDGSETFENNFDSILYKRSCLAGNTQWLNYPETFNYNVNQQNNATYSYTPDTTETMTITPSVDITLTDNEFELNENENLIFYTPEYRKTINYSNYLYFEVSEPTDSVPKLTWSKDTPTRLTEGQYIYFYETRDMSGSALYEIKAGEIFEANFNFDGNIDINNPPSLNNGKSISKLELNTGFIVPDNSVSLQRGYQIATNSINLVNSLQSAGTSYTLKSGEFFIYKISELSGITVLGEGTTLSAESAITQLNGYDPKQIQNNIDSGDLNTIAGWCTISTNIAYIINKIYIFGSGYIFKGNFETIASSSKLKTEGEIAGEKDAIQYKLTGSSDGFKSLPTLVSGRNYHYMLNLEITAEAYEPIKLVNKSTHKQTLTFNPPLLNSSGDSVETYPSSNFSGNTIVYVQLDKSMITNGTALSFNLSQSDIISLMQYINSNDTQINLLENSWTDLPPSSGITLPGKVNIQLGSTPENNYVEINNNITCFILPIYYNNPQSSQQITLLNTDSEGNQITTYITLTGSKKIYYLAVLPGTKIIGNDCKILNPLATNLGEKLGDLTITVGSITQPLKLFDLFKGTNTGSITLISGLFLETDYLAGDSEFNITYKVDKNKLIENPTALDTYFNKNHVYNKYVIAKLNSIEKLQIID